jgi:hypothetical protein
VIVQITSNARMTFFTTTSFVIRPRLSPLIAAGEAITRTTIKSKFFPCCAS